MIKTGIIVKKLNFKIKILNANISGLSIKKYEGIKNRLKKLLLFIK